MHFSHFNNGSLALTYSTNLAQPYELVFTEFSHSPAAGGQKVEVEYVQTFIAVS